MIFWQVLQKAIYIYKHFINQVMEGFELYSNYIEKYGTKAKVIMCPGGMGDVYICSKNCLSLIDKENDYYKPVFVVIRNASVIVARMFGVDNIELLPYEKRRKLLNMAMFMQFQVIKYSVIPPMMFALHYQIYTSMEGVHGNTELDHMRYAGHEHLKYCSIPLFKPFINNKAVNVEKGKTVLLIPYSVSMKRIGNPFWEKLTKRLLERGYKVITNSRGEDEPAIEGTQQFSVPIDELVPFVNYCGMVIGVRSGIMDVMETADIKRVVYYPEMKAGGRAFGRTCADSWVTFSLNKWYSKELALELYYFDEYQDYIIMKTMEYLN